jgi:hypothetical protein
MIFVELLKRYTVESLFPSSGGGGGLKNSPAITLGL